MFNKFCGSTILFLLCFTLQSIAQPTLQLTPHVRGLTDPVDITNAGDDRLFIVQQGGTIVFVQPDDLSNKTTFLDIDERVRSGGERGLLGLAFHPDYLNNGYFYVNYTNNNGTTVISRFSVMADDANRADPNSEQILLTQEQPFSNHNGGDLAFGADGYLYIGLGDGGSGGDPQNNSQNRTTFLGKILRIDVDNGDPYAIPADNPFVNEDFTLDEIWTLGWRNPWRLSFDRMTGDMWVADVGQDSFEEIDFEPAGVAGGRNYGWRCYEGNANFNLGNNCPAASELTFPVHQYPKPNNGCISVTGGNVYRGSESPALQGRYIYGDFCTGQLWSLMPDGNGGFTNEEFITSGASGLQISTFGEDQNGELYVADFSSNIVYKLSNNTISGVNEIVGLEEINVSPNPFQDVIQVEMITTEMLNLQIKLLNVAGKLMKNWQVSAIGNFRKTLTINNLPNGVYFLEIENAGSKLVRKIVKN